MKSTILTLCIIMLIVCSCGTMKGICQDGAWLLQETANNINAGEE